MQGFLCSQVTFLLFLDQTPNSTHNVEDWKIGCRVKRTKVGTETLIVKEEISEIVQRFGSQHGFDLVYST